MAGASPIQFLDKLCSSLYGVSILSLALLLVHTRQLPWSSGQLETVTSLAGHKEKRHLDFNSTHNRELRESQD